MPVITSIKQQKNKNRVNIYLDGKFSFGLDLENFLKFNLKVDQELSDSEIKEIVKKAEFSKTLEKLLNFTSLRPRSEKEVKDWLKRKKINPSIHNDLFEKLEKYDLIDDRKFAKWWVEQRVSFKKKSKRAIKYELRGKGIKSSVIDDVLQDADIDEEKNAKELLEKKERTWKRYDKETKKQKIIQYLQRQGFGWNIISKVIK